MAVVTVRVSDSIVDYPLGTVLRDIEVTDRVRRRVKLGIFQVIEGSLDDPEPAAEETPAAEPPAKNASRADWAKFLDAKKVEYEDDDTRDDLIDVWERHTDGKG